MDGKTMRGMKSHHFGIGDPQPDRLRLAVAVDQFS